VSSARRIPGIITRRQRLSDELLRELNTALTPFLTGLDLHLRTIRPAERFDRTLRTGRDQYLLYMVEIELTNRINRNSFSNAAWRMALIAHCLRDFRAGCRSMPGDVEYLCSRCDLACLVNSGSELLHKYNIRPYISASMDHRRLFKNLKEVHREMGVLGIACIPELVAGMRLCEELGIPAIGLPLDANRCSRWLGDCRETTFNMKELEKLISPVPAT
jgi:hypothetical protein